MKVDFSRWNECALAAGGKTPLAAARMKSKILAPLLAVALLAGCPATDKKPTKAKGKKQESMLPGRNQASDVSFQSFVGLLRAATAKRDMETIASMMTPDFGYRWDAAPEGETPFQYWDEKNLWPQLNSVLSAQWKESEGYMVAPPQFATDEKFEGYRAGISMVNGAWRFVYFVPAPPKE